MQQNSASPLQRKKTESYKIFDEIAGTYDFLNHVLSLGIDIWWRKILRASLATPLSPKGLKVLDLATGTGDLAIELAKDKKVIQVTGIDLSEQMILVGQQKLKALTKNQPQMAKISFQRGDAQNISFPDQSFDLATISFGIRNFPDPAKSLREIYRVLTPGGQLRILEFSLPSQKLFKAFYLFYLRNILPFIGKIFSQHFEAYRYLNVTIEDFPYGEQFAQLLKDAGFQKTQVRPLTFGIVTLYQGQKSE